jgi:hypothetical protein
MIENGIPGCRIFDLLKQASWARPGRKDFIVFDGGRNFRYVEKGYDTAKMSSEEQKAEAG